MKETSREEQTWLAMGCEATIARPKVDIGLYPVPHPVTQCTSLRHTWILILFDFPLLLTTGNSIRSLARNLTSRRLRHIDVSI
jgi:hypothetical protein